MTGSIVGLVLADVRHDCTLPATDHLQNYGEHPQTIARFRCPTCRTRWAYRTQFLLRGRFLWERTSGPSWRWSRAERRRLAMRASGDGGAL